MIEPQKILTISARDYCEMQGKNIENYEPIGIQDCIKGGSGDFKMPAVMKMFADEVPDEAEVVVNLGASVGLAGHVGGAVVAILSGTALIPKQKV